LKEMDADKRHDALAADYVAAVKQGKSALVISPTHAEGERVTQEIRLKLKAANKLGPNEREFVQLKNLQWTAAQRADARNYQTGTVIQFHQNVVGFRRGEQVTVTVRDGSGILVARHDGKTALLPLDMAGRFQVYESRKIALAAGDRVRITQNGFTKDRQRLNNGDLKEIAGFTKQGDIKLSNGWVIAKDFGNLTHGYCLTSYSSQSKGMDCVFVAESSESFRAAHREQFYVSASRFKESLTVYTDDKRELLAAVRKSSQRPAALDLVKKALPEVLKKKAHRVSRSQAVRQSKEEIVPTQKVERENVITQKESVRQMPEPVKISTKHKRNIGHRMST